MRTLAGFLVRAVLPVLIAVASSACATAQPARPTAAQESEQVAQWSGLPLGAWPVRVEVARAGEGVFALFHPAGIAGRPARIGELAAALCGRPGDGDPRALFADCYPQFASSVATTFPDEGVVTIAGTSIQASFEPDPAPGRFPVVYLMGSVRGRGLDLISTAESIASHGYVVAVAAIDNAPEQFGIDAATLDLMRRALRDVRGAVDGMPQSDMDRLAFGAWSMGGAATTLEALADPRADALLSFDDALIYQYGVDLITGTPDYAPETFTGALLLAAAGIENTVPKSQGVIDALSRARVTRIVAANMRHGDFSDQVRALLALPGGAPGTSARLDHANVVRGVVRTLDEVMSPGAASAQIDTSGTALFWRTADRLSAGEVLSEADWDRVFAHPGYAITQAAAQRRRAIVACMSAVFAPGGDVAATLAGFEGDWQAPLFPVVCDHLAVVRERRAEIEAFTASADMDALLEEAVAAAAAYLPGETMDAVARPKTYLILFERQGLGRDGAIVADALYTMDRPRQENVEFLGHEFHHAYRDTLREAAAIEGAEGLMGQLDRLVHEGVASMIDKAGHIRAGTIPYQFPPVFTQWAEGTPQRLAVIDAALAGLEHSPEGYRAAARVVRDNSPSGGHMNGVYMAMAIEEELGREALIAAQTGPLAFFTAYQAAAEALDDGRFRFSPAAMATLYAIAAPDTPAARGTR